MLSLYFCVVFFFFIDTATTEIYTYGHTLSLHDALPIYLVAEHGRDQDGGQRHRAGRHRLLPLAAGGAAADAVRPAARAAQPPRHRAAPRSEEHTSELQSLMRISYAVFCLKKKRKNE